jgi:hypothetical protein
MRINVVSADSSLEIHSAVVSLWKVLSARNDDCARWRGMADSDLFEQSLRAVRRNRRI